MAWRIRRYPRRCSYRAVVGVLALLLPWQGVVGHECSCGRGSDRAVLTGGFSTSTDSGEAATCCSLHSGGKSSPGHAAAPSCCGGAKTKETPWLPGEKGLADTGPMNLGCGGQLLQAKDQAPFCSCRLVCQCGPIKSTPQSARHGWENRIRTGADVVSAWVSFWGNFGGDHPLVFFCYAPSSGLSGADRCILLCRLLC